MYVSVFLAEANSRHLSEKTKGYKPTTERRPMATDTQNNPKENKNVQKETHDLKEMQKPTETQSHKETQHVWGHLKKIYI